MSRKRDTTEQIIQHLREAEVLLAQGQTIAQVCKQICVTDQTYYRWRKEYGGIRTDQAKRLKDLEKENARLKRLLADAELDKAILREAARRDGEGLGRSIGELAARRQRRLPGMLRPHLGGARIESPPEAGPGALGPRPGRLHDGLRRHQPRRRPCQMTRVR